MGGSLAVTPASSVSVGFNVAYLTNAHAADFVIPNSDRVLSSVDVTFSTIVWTSNPIQHHRPIRHHWTRSRFPIDHFAPNPI